MLSSYIARRIGCTIGYRSFLYMLQPGQMDILLLLSRLLITVIVYRFLALGTLYVHVPIDPQ